MAQMAWVDSFALRLFQAIVPETESRACRDHAFQHLHHRQHPLKTLRNADHSCSSQLAQSGGSVRRRVFHDRILACVAYIQGKTGLFVAA